MLKIFMFSLLVYAFDLILRRFNVETSPLRDCKYVEIFCVVVAILAVVVFKSEISLFVGLAASLNDLFSFSTFATRVFRFPFFQITVEVYVGLACSALIGVARR